MNKKKKTGRIIAGAAAGILIIVFIAASFMYAPLLSAVRSVKLLDKTPLYTMTYKGNYGLDKFIASGGAASDAELEGFLANYYSQGFYKPNVDIPDLGCSELTVTSPDGDALFGRNFDMYDSPAMFVRTEPENGYSSISMVNLDFIGYTHGYLPDSFTHSFLAAVAAPYVPMDGLNEKGLAVADLMVDGAAETHQDNGKTNLTTTTAIRLLLDKAATVDEAVKLLSQYDMHSSAGTCHHLAISDAEGHSVAVEYVDGKMSVIQTPCLTNFCMTNGISYNDGGERSKVRYDMLMKIYNSCGGTMKEDELMNSMQKASQDKTQWSLVYNQTKGKVILARSRDYKNLYTFSLKETAAK